MLLDIPLRFLRDRTLPHQSDLQSCQNCFLYESSEFPLLSIREQ